MGARNLSLDLNNLTDFGRDNLTHVFCLYYVLGLPCVLEYFARACVCLYVGLCVCVLFSSVYIHVRIVRRWLYVSSTSTMEQSPS